MPTNYPLTGGLDLTSVKALIAPGSLRECLNFEATTVAGYSRIGGVARFDGSEDVGSYKIWRLKYTGAAVISAGQQAWFDVALKGWVLSVAVQDGVNVVYLMVPGKHPAPGLPANLTDGTDTVAIMSRDAVFKGHGTQENFNNGYALIEADQIGRIGQVPGNAGSDIIGGFFFRDRLYVIRDLPRISFSGGYYTDDAEGQYITVDGLQYLILNVEITGDESGIITIDTSPGTGTEATPVGTPTIVDLPVTGDYGGGYTSLPYSDDLDVSGGTAPYTWSLEGEEGTAIDPIESPDANAIAFVPQLTCAALYRSGASGWVRVPLGREIQFNSGTTAISNYLRSAIQTEGTVTDSGYKFPGTATLNGVSVTSQLSADDGSEAALDGPTLVNEIIAKNFDFSLIPDNAIITGIEVLIERHSDTLNAARDKVVQLTGITGMYENKAKGPVWPNATATATYGSSTDLWGSQALTGAAVRSSSFGVRFLVERASAGTAVIAGVDRVQIKVHYILMDQTIYAWDGTEDVEMTLRYTQIIGGSTAGSNAHGYMTVDCATNADKPRLVNAGDELRTGPLGSGSLLALASGRDKPIWLAGQSEIDTNAARYMFERTNFFGQDEFEAVYGVCGASPAFSFDGTRCIRIRSELPADKDLPRHVSRHGDMLVLGYFSGAVLFSKVGNPNETRGSEGASVVEMGDRLVGIMPLAGDALGVICQSRTEVLRGLTPDAMIKSLISSKRGGIEYTATDMGRIVLCDGLGIFLADSPEAFGAAERNYISTRVQPWLAPRLHAQANSELAYQRPVAALSVRNKNQMRLYFWDGWCLTMTMTEPVQFTTQRYYTPAADVHTEPVPWVPRMIATGIDTSGRERLFCSFFGGVKEGYVYEIDASRSLDGDPIPAYIVLNPVTIEAASHAKRYDRFHIYGSGLSWATLTSTKAINDSNSFGGSTTFNMGRGDASASLEAAPLRGVVDSAVEAFDVSYRFDSDSNSEGVFTLQYMELLADDRGQSRGKQGSNSGG